MPQLGSVQIAGVLKQYMRQEKLNPRTFGELVGLSRPTVDNFLKGKKSPHAETIQLIEDFLKNEGAMTRFGFEPIPQHVEPDPIDREHLSGMSIVIPEKKPDEMKSEKKHYVCAFLDDREAARLITAIMNAPGTDQQREALLGKLLSQDFPSLCSSTTSHQSSGS